MNHNKQDENIPTGFQWIKMGNILARRILNTAPHSLVRQLVSYWSTGWVAG